MYGATQRHNLLTRAFELLNIKSGNMYLFDPNSPEFLQMQQAQSQAQQEADLKAQQQAEFSADITSRQVGVLEGQLQLDIIKEQHKMNLETQKQEHAEGEKDSRLFMDVEKQRHDMEMDNKELNLEKKQERNVVIG